ncbi:hypothetical protein DI09_15p280 [Mitosporidium daphniae]|uniref:Uncharacterized protein n=1 Tax=Mitosporidium daphniae TaxID=1485682 RepID=A0A098VXR8_9MICR|nr:uncharacterized protein DI09_15p280 [Mitosporidium daphniae]KGG52561.1 hypothetical protein DI09_15p280 [Mitosporidium daphniae]|eukprot:XP_013238988.1 uncharacterized protein DI09_15p280 [Mitosporidium daphniae]
MYVPGRLLYIYDVEDGLPVETPKSPTSTPVTRNADDPSKFDKFTAVVECDTLLFGQFFIQPYMIAQHNPIAYDDAIYNASQSILRGALNM